MSRLDKLKEQHPILNRSIIDILEMLDPTDSYKYLEFMIKRLKEDYGIQNSQNLDALKSIGESLLGPEGVKNIHKFETHSRANRVEDKDITQYKSWGQLISAVRKADEVERLKELEKQVVKLYSDGQYQVLIPLTKESNKMYGANTKWCTTMEYGGYWEKYFKSHKVIIFIDNLRNKKFALSKEVETNKIQVWDEMDNEVSVFECNLPSNVYEVIRVSFEKTETTEDVYYQIHPEEMSKYSEDYKTYYSIEDYDELTNNGRVVHDITTTNDYMDIIRRVMNSSYGLGSELDTSSVTDTFQRLMGGERRR